MQEFELPGYTVTGELGRGSAGPVYAAVRADGALVALKVLPTCTDDARGVLAEADLGLRLAVEGMVRCLGVESLPDGRTVLVMEQVTGGSLAGVVRARGQLSPGEAVTVVSPVARTLAALHAGGVVHGDVSPGNVLLDLRGRPLVSDLGVARLSGEAGLDAFGTPGFAAPEVAAGAPPSPAADVHAVGALAWFCLTGAAPAGLGLRGDLEQLAPGVGVRLRDAVLAALAHDPVDRPTAHELALDVFDAATAEPLRLRTADDDSTLITRRLRAAAQEDPRVDAVEVPTAVGVVTRARRGLLGAGADGGRRVATALAGVISRVGRRTRQVAGVAVALAVVTVVLGQGGVPQRVVGWASAMTSGTAQDAPGAQGEVADPPRPASAEPVVPATPPDSTATPAELRADPAAVVQALSDARAVALVSGRAEGLAGVDHPGSEAWTSDAAVLARLEEQAVAYEGLAFAVRSATPVTVEEERAVLRVEVDTSAYDVVSATGRRAEPAVAGKPVDLHLRRGDRGWRVEAVRAV